MKRTTLLKAMLAVTALLLVLLALAALVAALNLRGDAPALQTPLATDATTVQRGAYLARAGNCMACHTARGGTPYAGGRAIDTPFGTVYAGNLTPDADTGLGSWTTADFWRALHHGRSKDGRLLYPAFPYPNYTLVTRADSDALFAFLRSLPAVKQPNKPHALRFPYNLQASVAVWRALYFTPTAFEPAPAKSALWNRGSYLVRGLGHCVACHGSRNVLGAISEDIELGGGLIPMQNWYAPSLTASHEAGVAGWTEDEIVALLKNGVSPRASVMGPMAEVVFRSTQHLSDADLRAMAVFLQDLPAQPKRKRPEVERAEPNVWHTGAKLYTDRCASCHGELGEGVHGYPPLAGNRAVVLPLPHNVVKAILYGGFAPSTAGNPRPYGMPPFGWALNDEEVAAVATYIRQNWGHEASPVTPLDVLRAR
jgi:mono/diheme cytochrome c family protein